MFVAGVGPLPQIDKHCLTSLPIEKSYSLKIGDESGLQIQFQ